MVGEQPTPILTQEGLSKVEPDLHLKSSFLVPPPIARTRLRETTPPGLPAVPETPVAHGFL